MFEIINMNSAEETRKFFADHSLIQPPKRTDKDVSKRYYRYIIDSRDRNLSYYPDPNNYELKLSEDIRDVQSVELVSFDIPFTKYLINENNRIFAYKILGDANNTIIQIDEGTYTLQELVDEINEKNTDTSTTFGLKKTKNKMTIKTEGAGGYILSAGNEEPKDDGYERDSAKYVVPLCKILGLKSTEHFYFGGDQVEYEFPYQVDLRTDRYIAMHLGQTSLNYSENTSTNKCFAIIKKDELESKYMDVTYKKYYNPPIPAMQTLRIKFTDYDGNLYDFHNQDHLLELQFCCFKNQRKYDDIFDR